MCERFGVPPRANLFMKSAPTYSPWGHPQQTQQIADGIWSVSTAGHGGVYVAPELLAQMPDYLRAGTGYSSNGWFEEDCDWALACAAFPHLFSPRWCFYAWRQANSAGSYLKDRWAKYLASPTAAILKQIAETYAAQNPQDA